MKTFTIQSIHALQIFDSRGNPTVEADIILTDGSFGRFAVPSGASTGSHEAIELRDGGTEYKGKGVKKAVAFVNTEISDAIVGKEFTQSTLDKTLIDLDGTPNKSRLGANAILAASGAFLRACAGASKLSIYEYAYEIGATGQSMKLPVPLMNVMNGGKHALKSADFQEFMIVPVGAKTFTEAMRMGSEVFHTLKKILDTRGSSTTVGDEGGFGPSLSNNEEALTLIMEALEKAGYKAGSDFGIALDVASSELYIDGKYVLESEGRSLTSSELIDLYVAWCEKYPIVSIEDGLAEDDWAGYQELTERLGNKIQLVGDDLFVTNIERLQKGIDMNVTNSILIKVNQIGTITETIDAMNLACQNGYTCVMSHRSGETEDSTIAHLAVGLGTGQIKTGSCSRSDRMAKYNQLLRIEEKLGDKAVYVNPFLK